MVLKSILHICLWLVFPVIGCFLYPFFKDDPVLLQAFSTGIIVYVLFFSVVIHELSHGLAAYVSGDPTAKDAGRITLNPIKHISVVGSILVPLILYALKTPAVLGWAKPVPFNPVKLKSYPRDQVFLTMAGPFSNFALSYIFMNLFLLLLFFLKIYFPDQPVDFNFNFFRPVQMENLPFSGVWYVCYELFFNGILINLVLGLFNLIPFPPLDGFWIVKLLFPGKAASFLGKIQIYGFIILIVAVFFGFLSWAVYPFIMVIEFYQKIIEFLVR